MLSDSALYFSMSTIRYILKELLKRVYYRNNPTNNHHRAQLLIIFHGVFMESEALKEAATSLSTHDNLLYFTEVTATREWLG